MSQGDTKMSVAERKERIDHLSDWLDDVRCAVGLSDWTLNFRTNPSADGATADCWRRPGSKEGTVRFSDDFFESDREAQRETVIHELLHFHMRYIFDVTNSMERVLGRQAWEVFDEVLEAAEEAVIDSIARAIAHRFKLPPAWPADEPEGPEGVEVPVLMRFPDGDELRRTLVVEAEGLAALTDAITGIQAAQVDKEGRREFTDRMQTAAARMLDPDGDGQPDYKLASGVAELAVTEDATPEIVAAEEEVPIALEWSEASGIPEMQEYRPEPVELPAFDPAERPMGKRRPKGMA